MCDSLFTIWIGLLLKDEEYRQNKAEKAYEVIPSQSLVLHYELHYNRKYRKRNDLLNNFQLPNGEWTTILYASEPICRNHKAILKKGNQPTNEDYRHQADALESRLKHHLAIPRQGHKEV